jgi:NTP pyrophosphatase (non-canonical NTP hydrolase)
MGYSLDDLAQQIREFGAKTFPTSTPESTAEHLRREVIEILADPTNGEEQADAFFLLIQLARVSGNDLAAEVARKLEINLNRKWKAPDFDGVIEHVKE